MHLKALTLRGFKSFASATTLRFEPGITCVVGPNGSGKSNVVDALSWVMGEQGAKSLRGGKMEDVIFAGTTGRPPLGRAEVSLTIDNSDGALPIEYSEVTITRIMFRNGGSEYQINGDTCRLLDIQELLSDSGIGREMHVIVGQGQLDSVLHADPMGRRAFIEEAAGVLKHRKRKEKALRKLDSMQANLARVQDLTDELRRRLKPLGRQAAVARRAAVIQADLRDARLRLLADDLVRLREALRAEIADEAALKERKESAEAELKKALRREVFLEDEVRRLAPRLHRAQQTWYELSHHEDLVSLAAVNGPSAVVLSGDETTVTELAARLAADGRKTSRLRVSHAFHSPLMAPMLDEFRSVVEGLTLHSPLLPVVSDVTGEPATVAQLTSPDYWVDHVRQAVRFADSVDWLARHDVTAFLELGPDSVLSAMAQNCLDAAGSDALTVPALREGRPEDHTFTAALAALHTQGTALHWDACFTGTGARRTDLPTYTFQRRRYWPRAVQGGAADLRSVGLGAAHHPLLSAAVSLADSEGALLTGRISLLSHPWLADHTVRGATLLPGTAFLELAVRAGDEVGCDRVDELTLAAPLVLPEQGGVQVQLWIGNPDASGRRSVTVYGRPDADEDAPWTSHATGVLSASRTTSDFDATVWPPADAETLPVDGLYERLADGGFGYGPLFQGLRAAWRRGEEVFAEVVLPESGHTDAESFGLHPALLDSALHAASFVDLDERAAGGLPFSWEGVSLHASGATTLRVRLAPAAGDAVAIAVADDSGQLVLSADSLILRAVAAREIDAAAALVRDALFRLDWVPVTAVAAAGTAALVGEDPFGLRALPQFGDLAVHPDLTALAAADGAVPDTVLLPLTGTGPDTDPVTAAHRAATEALAAVRTWLEQDERFAASRLALVTRGATTGHDPAAAAVWGLVRSAQSENPGRFLLVDLDADQDTPALPAAALTSEEPQLAVRGEELRAARLVRRP
ncbi:polyketide synthase dehydratase domain-containing protein, partial [Streptomyces nodosus]